ncbi:uncharacterized protein [Equus asinus]|uniref:uncharacterized protein n=1 Tax=Equus asinus TaxID=9793 RepID=UPI0038F6D4F6
MNSAAEARRARARGRRRRRRRLAAARAPLTHARPRSHRARPLAAARTSWSWLAPQSSARTRFFRAASPRRPPPRPRARLADARGPFRTPGPRLPAARHSHRHSPWAPHAHCTQAGDGMDAGRGGTETIPGTQETGITLKAPDPAKPAPTLPHLPRHFQGKVTAAGVQSPCLAVVSLDSIAFAARSRSSDNQHCSHIPVQQK